VTKYFLHIGLHKTGTKFFQHKVFPSLDRVNFLYNPPKLTQYICDLYKASEEDIGRVLERINDEKKNIESKNENRTILISREIMSGDLFSFYREFDKYITRLSVAIPEANIICFLRYQVDWLLSCYRESIHEHHYQGINEFMFSAASSSYFVGNCYKELDYKNIIETLYSKFNNTAVHFYFYENFKKNPKATVVDLGNLIGSTKVDLNLETNSIPNRGYSALAIKISLIRYKFFKKLNFHKMFIHRPIVFFGEASIPAGFEHLSALPVEKYWRGGFLLDNEEIRSKNYPKLNMMEKIGMELSWRNLMKNRLDRLIYYDWDLLGHKREELDHYFKNKNQEISESHPSLNFPDPYL